MLQIIPPSRLHVLLSESSPRLRGGMSLPSQGIINTFSSSFTRIKTGPKPAQMPSHRHAQDPSPAISSVRDFTCLVPFCCRFLRPRSGVWVEGSVAAEAE